MCGIATDYCVKATAADAVDGGFTTTVLLDLTAAVAPANTDEMIAELAGANVAVKSAPSSTTSRRRSRRAELLAPVVPLPAYHSR